MDLDVSASALNMQADLKAIEMDAFLAKEYTKPNKSWSSRPTACHLLSHGGGRAKGSGVDVKDFDLKAPCSNSDEVAQ